MLLRAIRKSKEEEEQAALLQGINREGTCSHKNAEDDTNMDATPLRLIDVEATIRSRNAGGIIFTRCRSWHVISHTWSADVRELSKIIGKRLVTAASMGPGADIDAPDLQAHQSYEQLFEAANFNEESSYKKLVEFLIILRSDGVRWVWFDAVCINQQDKEEKEREIQQMGMYYERSIGCHVVHHGIGRGFEVLLSQAGGGGEENGEEEEEEVLPRWFSRAWTFQEWILPPKTTFIIDLASEPNLERTAYAILLNEYELDQSCSCCYFETSLSPNYIRNCMNMQAATAHYEGSVKAVDMREDDGDLASFPMDRTRRCCRPSIHEPHFSKIPKRRNWYFVDDLGFAFLIRVKLQMAKVAHNSSYNPGAGLQQQKDIAFSDEEYELTRRLQLKGYFRGESDYSITKEKKIRLTIEEMQQRNCSNAEDRVLSVLKLLGVEGVVQVRSEKSLEEQVINLARICLQQRDDAMVLQLCLVDGFGNETRDMSWAPHFEVTKGSWQAGAQSQELSGSRVDVAAHHFESFRADAEVRELSSEGGLRVAASVCLGHLVCCEHQYTTRVNPRRAVNSSAGTEPFRRVVLQVDGQALVYLCARITSAASATAAGAHPHISRAEYACVLEIAGVETSSDGRSACIAFPAVAADESISRQHDCLQQLRDRIPVWLVKMGVGMHGSAGVTYLLVCIGAQTLERPLHKIGYVGISSTSQTLALLTKKQSVCYIAGTERSRLNEHLFRIANDRWICMNFCLDHLVWILLVVITLYITNGPHWYNLNGSLF